MRDITLNKNTIVKWKEVFIVILFLFPFFEPLSLRYIVSSSIAPLFEYWRFFSSLLVILIYIIINKGLSKNVLYLGVFIAAYFAISLNSVRWTLLAFFTINIAALYMFFEIMIKRKKNTVIVSMFYLLFFLVLINLICLIFHPEGIVYTKAYRTWNSSGYFNVFYDYIHFLERDNRLINFLLPLWFSMMICYSKGYINKRLSFLVMFAIDLTIVLVWSATSVIGGTLMTIAYISIVFFKKKVSLLKFRNTVVFLVICNVGLLCFNIQNAFSFLIENILGKSLTLTGRTVIWESAKKMIIESPIFGYGTRQKGYIIHFSGSDWYAHNFILDILIQGGALLLMAFIFIIYRCYKSLLIHADKYTVNIMLVAFACWGIMGLVESFFYQYSFWVTLAILTNLKHMES
ncbi:O-antigen ligase family protein [Priestia sp. D3YE.R1]|uniref:O-antigen ligase family protein n=1 Tax=Priestia sp. D3YE.R1 TaxID=3400416 RepID=UPI003BA38B83